ncbi:hypothetical protein EFE42_03485 [Methanohalophilus sp. RSK]|uniref:hypothetical protein n=1 Tax=Methanohalophilus sp. RSK TaxID=2485783 RepID=UPI000F43932F|nr:hypothetical protein [Methanohalophilus sp. RSK]RNI14454.1 hypothetical protein EFE42_03485 [Methanohalophilus sp. RSK]
MFIRIMLICQILCPKNGQKSEKTQSNDLCDTVKSMGQKMDKIIKTSMEERKDASERPEEKR